MKKFTRLSALVILCIVYVAFNTVLAQANAGINPAHGAPGHRCDIAVGAPLNTAATAAKPAVANIQPGQSFPGMLANPKKSNTPNIVAANPAQSVSVQKPSVTVAPGKPAASTSKATAALNPAHGQPNHRCDIAVGAPLNSPASKTTTNAVQQATPLQNSPVKNTSGAKINPAHGQPGHDCSVEVGKPLKQ